MVDWGSVQRPSDWDAPEGAFDDAEDEQPDQEGDLTAHLEGLNLHQSEDK